MKEPGVQWSKSGRSVAETEGLHEERSNDRDSEGRGGSEEGLITGVIRQVCDWGALFEHSRRHSEPGSTSTGSVLSNTRPLRVFHIQPLGAPAFAEVPAKGRFAEISSKNVPAFSHSVLSMIG